MSVFIALTALIVSVWQGYETRKHNRLTVKPILNFTKNYNSTYDIIGTDTVVTRKYQLVLSNNGTGPAIVKSFKLYFDGEELIPEEGFYLWGMLNKITPKDIRIAQSGWLDGGDVVKIGDDRSLIRCNIVDDYLNRTEIEIIYQSIYEEEQVIRSVLMDRN